MAYLNYHYMNTKKPRVAIYSRVSSAETKTKANGEKRQHVENQLGQLRTFAMGQGWEVIKEYVDHESGLKSDRPEFKNLLASASRHEFDIVLFWALDRFSREGAKKLLLTSPYLKTTTSVFDRSLNSIWIRPGFLKTQ